MTVMAPFTAGQVASLNEFQASGAFHPFTCKNETCLTQGRLVGPAVLIAREDGWYCPSCSYTQGWAHQAMADGTWKNWQGIKVQVDGGDPVLPQIGETGWTDERIAEFQQEWERRKYEPVKIVPPAPLLTPELARELLRECVTVVRPGEVLVIRLKDWTPDQVEMYQQWMDVVAAEHGVRALTVVGEELAVAAPESDGDFAARIERVWPDLERRSAERRASNWGRPV